MSDLSKAVVPYRGRRNSNAENIPPSSRPSSPFDHPHRSRASSTSRPHTLHLQYITPPFVFEYFSNPNVTVFIAARVMYTPPYPGFSQDNGGGGYGHHLPNGYIPSAASSSSSPFSSSQSSQSSQSSNRSANRLYQPNLNGSTVAMQGSGGPYGHSTTLADNSENNRSQQTIPQDNQWPHQQQWYQAPLQHYQQPMFGQGPGFGHQDQQQHSHHGHSMIPQNQYQNPGLGGGNNPSYHFHFGNPGSYDVNFSHNNAKYE